MNNGEFKDAYGWALIIVLACAMVALFVNFQAGALALVFAAAAWWVWDNPEEGLLLFLVISPVLPMFKITQTIGTVTLIKDVVIFTLFARVVLVPLARKSLPYRRNIFVAPVVALALWSIIETLRADSIILGILRLRDIGLYIVLYVAVLYLPHSTKIWKRRLAWFAASLAIVLGLAVFQWFFAKDSAVLRFDPVREVWIPRLSSVMAHPSIFGEYLVASFTVFGAITLYARSMRYRAWAFSAALVLLPFIFLSYSRAVWLGLFAACGAMGAVYMFQAIQRKADTRSLWRWGSMSAVLGVLTLIILLRLTPAGGLARSIVDPTYGSNLERITFFVRLVAPTTNTQAVFGRGLGDVLEQNFRNVTLDTYDIASGSSRSVQLTKNRTLVDNQYLKTFVEMGVVGLVLYGWIYWRFGYHAYRLVLTERGPIIGLAAIGFLAAFMIQALFIDIWDIYPTNALFWIAAAFVSLALQEHEHFGAEHREASE